jgi:hypothetical protein
MATIGIIDSGHVGTNLARAAIVRRGRSGLR